MKNEQKIILVFFAMISLAIFFACRHQLDNLNGNDNGNGGGGVTTPTSSCNPDSIYFANEIMPIISSNCTMSGCHDNTSHADGVNLTSYSKIIKYVSAGSASNSKLYKVIIRTGGERMPPPPMSPLTADQKAKIEKWINQGAKNNSCLGDCDTTVFTYSAVITKIINNKCVGCHNPSNAGGNIDLSTYAGVKAVAISGQLYGSVAHQPGYSAMPQNAAKLSDCEIRQVQLWINAGTLNN